MLVTSKELFKKAQEGKFAIPAPTLLILSLSAGMWKQPKDIISR